MDPSYAGVHNQQTTDKQPTIRLFEQEISSKIEQQKRIHRKVIKTHTINTATMVLDLTTTAFANATAVLNILPIASGIHGVWHPADSLKLLGFPEPSNPKDRKLAHALTRTYAVRQACMGLTSLALWWAGDHRLMGALMLVNTPIAIVDGLVSRWLTGGGEWGHWGFMPLAMVLTAGLLGAPRGDVQ